MSANYNSIHRATCVMYLRRAGFAWEDIIKITGVVVRCWGFVVYHWRCSGGAWCKIPLIKKCVVSVVCCSCDPGHHSTVTLVKNYDLKLEAKIG